MKSYENIKYAKSQRDFAHGSLLRANFPSIEAV